MPSVGLAVRLTGIASLFSDAAFGIFNEGARKLGNSATIVGEGAVEGIRDGAVEGISDGDALFAIAPVRALLIESYGSYQKPPVLNFRTSRFSNCRLLTSSRFNCSCSPIRAADKVKRIDTQVINSLLMVHHVRLFLDMGRTELGVLILHG